MKQNKSIKFIKFLYQIIYRMCTNSKSNVVQDDNNMNKLQSKPLNSKPNKIYM